MRKRKVTVPHPITGEPFTVELQTITVSSGEQVTGYRFGAGFVEYEKPRAYSAYFETAEQEERFRRERTELAAIKGALQHPQPLTPENAARHRLSPIEVLQRDIDAGNMAAVVARLRKVEADRDALVADCCELQRLVHALLDAADARSAAGSASASERDASGVSVAERNRLAIACAVELRKVNPRLSDAAIAERIRRTLCDPRSTRTIRRAIAEVGRQSADGQKETAD